MPKLKYSFAAIGLTLSLVTGTAQASLSGALDGMLVGVSSPIAYESQRRMGLIGGSVTLRSPIRNVNITSFDPPRLTAGCGGVDFFGGAFSFINADDLVNLFRRIAQNAVGLIFMRALEAIDPKLANLISTIQSKLQSLNQLSANTCAIAKGAVDTLWDSTDRAATIAEKAAEYRGAIGGFFDDLFASREGVVANKKDEIRKACEDGSIEFCGNVVWDLMADNKVGRVLGGGAFAGLSEKYAAELIMSMTGTFIYDPRQAASANEPPPMIQRPGKIDIHDLKTGRSEGGQKVKYVCSAAPAREGCRNMTEATWDWEGTFGYTNRMLFGSIDGSTTTADSIVGKMSPACTGSCTLTVTQQQFVGATKLPFLSLMLDVQSQPGAAAFVAAQAAPLIAEELHIVLSEAVMRAARQILETKSGTKIPEQISVRIRELGDQYSRLLTNRDVNTQEYNAMHEFVRALASRDPAIMQFVRSR
jgi:conjugative transfer pilus assembly protein TraH